MGRFVIIAMLLGLLGVVGAFVVVAWEALGTVQFSVVGIGALIGGVVLSLLVGGGLMALVFYSARRGYDERAHTDRPDFSARRDDPQD